MVEMDSTGTAKVNTDPFNALDVGRWLESGSTENRPCNLESRLLGGLPLGRLCSKVTGLH